MEEQQELMDGDLVGKTAHVLGVERKHVLPVVGLVVVLMGIVIFLAVISIVDLRGQFFSGDSDAREVIIRMSELPVEIEVGGAIPDVASGDAMKRGELCGPHLKGEDGLKRGWLWNAEKEVCVRVHRSLR